MLGSNDFYIAAQLFQPYRLTLARELQGLTKSDLAQRIDKTTSAISQFESGRAHPDAHTLATIAMALGVPAYFFVSQGNTPLIPFDTCHFRSLRSASQRSRRQLLAVGTLILDLVYEIEEYVELPDEQIPMLNDPVETADDLENRASEVRRRWGLGLGPIGNMTWLLESKGIIISPMLDDAREVDAFSFWHRKRPFIFLLSSKDSTSRTRWDAAHELGHLVLHADATPGNPELERQAHYFAGAFLLPRDSFIDECPRKFRWEHFCELKKRWKVSIAALAKRGHDIGVLSDASYRRAFTYLNRTNQRLKEPLEPTPEPPMMISEAIGLLAKQRPLEEIAASIGLTTGFIQKLVPSLESA